MLYLMNINTGLVDTFENWLDDAKGDNKALSLEIGKNLLYVTENVKGKQGYTNEFGQWRPV